MTKEMPHDELIQALSVDDVNSRRKAENALYLQYAYMVNTVRGKYSLDEDGLADAYTDTMMAVFEQLRNGMFDGRSSLKTYITRIFYNKCVDLSRKKTTMKGKAQQHDDVDGLQVADSSLNFLQHLMQKELVGKVKAVIGLLGSKCQDLILRWGEGYTDKEITELLGYKSEDVTKISRLRCLQNLKSRFQP
jgi:RNA polymerase sigma factor (sigma-70 family)